VAVVAEPSKVLGRVLIPLTDVLHATGGLLDQEYLLHSEGELRECYVSLRLKWTPAAPQHHHRHYL
jgi:hypothetical protein